MAYGVYFREKGFKAYARAREWVVPTRKVKFSCNGKSRETLGAKLSKPQERLNQNIYQEVSKRKLKKLSKPKPSGAANLRIKGRSFKNEKKFICCFKTRG